MQETNKNTTSSELLKVLSNATTPLLIMDSRFDFDALCSAVALEYFFKTQLNKSLTIFYSAKISQNSIDKIQDYFSVENIVQNVSISEINFSQFDILICADTGTLAHLSTDGDFTLPTNLPIVNFDHHLSNNYYGTYNYVKMYGSTCTVLFELFKAWEVNIDPHLAQILIIGVYTDNGFFQYETVKPEDFNTVAELLKIGASVDKFLWKMTFNESYTDIKLRKIIYNNLQVDFEKKYAYSTYSPEELKALNIDLNENSIPPSDMLKRLSNVDYVFVIGKEQEENNSFKVSLRSHELSFNVAIIAANFGGGGHKRAAGCLVEAESVAEVVKLITEEAAKQQ